MDIGTSLVVICYIFVKNCLITSRNMPSQLQFDLYQYICKVFLRISSKTVDWISVNVVLMNNRLRLLIFDLVFGPCNVTILFGAIVGRVDNKCGM